MWYFYRKQPNSSFKPACYGVDLLLLKLMGSSSSGSCLRVKQRRLSEGLGSFPLPSAPLPVPPHQNLYPSGCPSIHSWVLGLGRAAAQTLILASFTSSLFLQALSLGFARQKIVCESASYSGLLLPVPGSRSWQTHREHRWRWLQSEPEKQRHALWVVWNSSLWFKALKTWHCGSEHKNNSLAWLVPKVWLS